jgi:hypothetical protein
MRTEIITSPVTTFATSEVLGGAVAHAQPDRDQIRAEVQRTVKEAVQAAEAGAREGRAAADADRLASQLDQARAAVAELETHAPGGNVSITREGNNVIIQMADGRRITLDQSIVPPPAIEGLVASLAPPPMPPPMMHQDGPPESVIRLVGVIFVCITIMVLGWSWARAFARRGEARAVRGGGMSPDVPLRLERIEQAVDAMAVEMERVSEAQRYAARLLTERLPESTPQLASAGARVHNDRA